MSLTSPLHRERSLARYGDSVLRLVLESIPIWVAHVQEQRCNYDEAEPDDHSQGPFGVNTNHCAMLAIARSNNISQAGRLTPACKPRRQCLSTASLYIHGRRFQRGTVPEQRHCCFPIGTQRAWWRMSLGRSTAVWGTLVPSRQLLHRSDWESRMQARGMLPISYELRALVI